jgi:hypothetical protein
MINIITKYAFSKSVSGPSKVLNNTIKGLDMLGYPYVINKTLTSTKRIWIQSGWDALPFVKRLKAKCVIGPNVALYPQEIAQYDIGKAIYLQPGPTAVSFWEILGFNQCPLMYWPVGIDTDHFIPITGEEKSTVMLYHKHRPLDELNNIINKLNHKRISFQIVPYGAYDEEEYIDVLRKSRYCIWHGRLESQGIALQEALSCNVPMIVCDVTHIGQLKHARVEFPDSVKHIPATSIPYFSEACGIRVTNLDELEEAIDIMEGNAKLYEPRSYVIENLSLEGQAKKLVDMWEYWGMTYCEGMHETAQSDKNFKIPKIQVLLHKILQYHLNNRER